MLKIVKDSVLKVSRSLGYDIVPLRDGMRLTLGGVEVKVARIR